MTLGKVVGNAIVYTYSGVTTKLAVVEGDMVRINSNHDKVYFRYNLIKDELRAVVAIGGLTELILVRKGPNGEPLRDPMSAYINIARAVRSKVSTFEIDNILKVRTNMNKKLRKFTKTVLHDERLDAVQIIYFDKDLAKWCNHIDDGKLIIDGITISVSDELRDAIKDSLLVSNVELNDGEEKRYLHSIIGRTIITSFYPSA